MRITNKGIPEIRRVYVWVNYQKRELGIAGRVKIGQKVKLIKKSHGYGLIEFGFLNKKRGYINLEFLID